MDDATSPSAPGAVSCSICGDPLQPSDRFCGSCGALVNACRSCGQRLVAGDRYCPSCGQSADSAQVTARISGGGAEAAHSPWTGIFDKLQTATLGEFQVIRELGRGGMAAVYLAHDIHLDRKVAIKVMSPMLASDQKMVERFRREAKTGAGLKHPNIGTVHRVLEGEGLYFFVMDFIRGRPLDAIIHRNGVLSVDVTRALLYQIGSGLAYAHRRKIYHRDVKPANVLVSGADGTAVVTDFGIAKVAESPNQTQTGAIVGTPAYMAPEQILGREITAAVDQYALGVMAYEMLTGAPPFVGTSFVVMHAHTELQPRSVRESRPDCPVDLDEAIARMLAKDPTQRWPSLPHALAAMGATVIGEDDPIREELIRLATPDDVESERFTTNTPLSPPPPIATRGANIAMVAISPPPELIEVGDSFRLVASPRDMQGAEITSIPVDWATTNEAVLSVQTDGTIVAHAAGTAEVSATAGRARGAVLLTVEPSRVSSLHMSIPPGMLMAGDRIQLSARPVDKRQNPLPYPVRWGVADPNIARVSPDGVLEARAPGTVEVYAESNGVRGAARVQVSPPAVAAVQLSVDPLKPVVGDRVRVMATPVDAHGRPVRDRSLGWSLSDLSLVKIVSDGVYEAVSPGTLRVTAACEGHQATIDVVISVAPVAALRISPPPATVVAGSTFRLTATPLDTTEGSLANRPIAWSTSDSRLATVTPDGTVTANGPGDVKIVASCEGKSASVAVSIKPAPVTSVRIIGLPATVYLKMSLRLSAIVTDSRGQKLQKTPEWRSSNVAVITMSPAGQGTALSVGRARISAFVDGVEGTIDVDVAEPPIPKVVVVPAPAVPSEFSATGIVSSNSAPVAPPASRQAASSTPVVAPAVPARPEPARAAAPSAGGKRGLVFASAGATLVVIAVVVALTAKSNPPVAPQRADSPAVQPAATPTTPAATVSPPANNPPPDTAQPKAPQPVEKKSAPQRSAQMTAAKTAPNPVSPPARPPVRQPDVFKITVLSSPPPMHIGDRATLRASVERTSGTAAMPRVSWESSRPAVLAVDAATGTVTAIAEGQATVSAVGGGTRADVAITVLAAAPVVAAPAPAPVRQQPAAGPPPTETPARPAGPSPEEIRAKGGDALRESANAMATALKSKDIATATRLFGDARNGDAQDLLQQLPKLFDLKVVAQLGQPQVTDRAGSLDYQVAIHWTTPAGPGRDKLVTIRAEAERAGDAWTIARHRLVGGWR